MYIAKPNPQTQFNYSFTGNEILLPVSIIEAAQITGAQPKNFRQPNPFTVERYIEYSANGSKYPFVHKRRFVVIKDGFKPQTKSFVRAAKRGKINNLKLFACFCEEAIELGRHERPLEQRVASFEQLSAELAERLIKKINNKKK